MPIYYLDIFDGREVIRDDSGQESPDLAAIRVEADEAVRELLAATIGRHEPIDNRELRVRDASGSVVHYVRFVDVIA